LHFQTTRLRVAAVPRRGFQSLEEVGMTFGKKLQRFVRDEDGAALAEYGILVAFIAIVAITAVTFFGSKISAKFSLYANQLS
jgi:Flp pilus assembly protein, pilin Flp